VVGAGNSAAEIAVELALSGAAVDLSVRTAPNIVRRDTFGIPSQLLGIALKNAPERLMNPLSTVLRRLTVPNLDRFGLPAPAGEGFTQFLRTCTVPILDHGFVREVRAGRIRIVPAVNELVGNEVQLVDGSTIRPDAVICATGYRPGLEDMVGHLGVLDDSGTPVPHGPDGAPHARELYFVGITVQLAGLLREIGRDARAVGDRVEATAQARSNS
jgi:cation diffusion facilitator CzcD-associated flavoprotein CzcO